MSREKKPVKIFAPRPEIKNNTCFCSRPEQATEHQPAKNRLGQLDVDANEALECRLRNDGQEFIHTQQYCTRVYVQCIVFKKFFLDRFKKQQKYGADN